MYVGIDNGFGVIREISFTPANVHVSQELDKLISNDERLVFGDKAYFDTLTKKAFRQEGI